MRFLIVSTFTLMFLASSLAQAADLQLAKQIAVLQQQVTFLQKELSAFQAIINRAPDGTIRVTAQQNKQEVTGGHAQADIGGNQNFRISGSSSEAVGGSQSITVGTTQTESIGRTWFRKSGKMFFRMPDST